MTAEVANPWAMDSLAAILNTQAGLVSMTQLWDVGMTRAQVRANLDAGRWLKRSHLVISTFTGELTREQMQWLGVLHGGPGALIGGLSALEVHGLRSWERPVVTVLVPNYRRPKPLPGLALYRCRPLVLAAANRRLPLQRIEPAALWFASTEPRLRTAHGLLAAVVQQRLSTPERLTDWTERMAPMKGADEIRRVLTEFAGGAQSMAEVDVGKFCKEFGFVLPTRQRNALRHLDSVLDPNRHWQDQVEAAMTAYLGVLAENPIMLRALFIDILGLGAQGLAARRRVNEAIADFLLGVVNPARDNAVMTSSMAMAVVGGINELVLQLIEQDQVHEIQSITHTTSALIRAVVGTERPRGSGGG